MKKMFKFIINLYILIVLFNNYQTVKAQVHLSKDNLYLLCNCTPSVSSYINLDSKKISSIDPSTFNGLTSLIILFLASNKLTKIDPSTFNGLTSLYDLDISFNQLTTVNPSTFNGLAKLEFLRLNRNQLTTIDPSTFKGLPLVSLWLSHNKLTKIDPSTFNKLTKLHWLRLDNNQINRIEEGTFKDLINLSYLNLETNNIVSFNQYALFGSINLEKVCLFPNPISNLYPTSMNAICHGNPKCVIFTTIKCPSTYLLNAYFNIFKKQ